MPETLPENARRWVKVAGQLAADALAPLAASQDDPTSRSSRDKVITASRDAGLFELTRAEGDGNEPPGSLTLVAVRDELASFNLPIGWIDACFGPRPGLLDKARGALRETHLAPFLEGRLRGGFGFTEPGDATHYTRARRHEGRLELTGRKSYVTNGAQVDFLYVLAEIEDEGRAFVVVDTDLPGVVTEKTFTTLDGSRHAAFRFEAVNVPLHHLLGTPGEGMKQALGQIGNERLLVAAEAVGLCRWVVTYLEQRLRERESRHGVSEALRLRYGELRIAAFAARSTVYRAARIADSDQRAINETIAAKAFATETLGRVIDEAIQLDGGGALVSSHPLAELYQRVRVLRVAEGLTDTLRLNVARGALDLGKGRL